jgi:phosphoribosylaminoimidazole-succinocarboxamide synthase
VQTTAPVFETFLDDIQTHWRGKVRDMYEVDDYLLMVATDRISAYDCILGSAIPDKGKVLTQLSAFWFNRTQEIVPNHMVAIDPADYPESLRPHADVLTGRSMLVTRTRPVLIECVARGYLAGSGWKEYQQTGSVCGLQLPPGLRESDRLPEPIFTPATKAESGHDINISEAEAAKLIGDKLVDTLRELTLALYRHGADHAESCGIIMADTKFEFGLVDGSDGQQNVMLIDEALTPDSSRFWPKDEYTPGQGQTSFDKQYVRDYLDEIKWNRQPPVPELPPDVVDRTRQKYLEAYRLLAGSEL